MAITERKQQGNLLGTLLILPFISDIITFLYEKEFEIASSTELLYIMYADGIIILARLKQVIKKKNRNTRGILC